MAEDSIDKAIEVHNLPKTQCKTEHLSIHGSKTTTALDLENHLYIYGNDISEILKLQENEPKLKEKLHPNYEYSMAEVVWAIRHEMARTTEDILARRVRLLFLDARAAIESAEKVSVLLAEELDKDEIWIQNQIAAFKTVANGFLLEEFRVL